MDEDKTRSTAGEMVMSSKSPRVFVNVYVENTNQHESIIDAITQTMKEQFPEAEFSVQVQTL